MSLNSFNFVISGIGLSIILGVLQLFKKKIDVVGRVQLFFLLLFSYFFIFTSDLKFCLCVLIVTIITYICGRQMEKSAGNRKVMIVGSILLIGFLAYFKYTNFFISSFSALTNRNAATLNIILPMGVSFYIFSALSYLIDVYRGDYDAEKNILDFALYISFFPKLTAGPIVRGVDFFPQIKNYRGIEWEAFKAGIQIYVFGLFKKMVIADHLGVFVDDVFHAPAAFNTGTVILAAVSYSFQIYFDFSGYSDMAIGIAKVIGFDFKRNFNLPYIAENESDFWGRWHISLSSWFRDYLYIPLGGSRKGEGRTYANLLITMTVSGLWHGAGWTFIVWGLLHGVMSCIHRFLKKYGYQGHKVVNIVVTFTTVTFLWVVFRADSFSNAMAVISGMFTIHSGISQPYTWSFFAIAVWIIAVIIAKMKAEDRTVNGFYPVLDLGKFWAQVVFFTFCGLTIIMGYYGNTAFIYGKF